MSELNDLTNELVAQLERSKFWFRMMLVAVGLNVLSLALNLSGALNGLVCN